MNTKNKRWVLDLTLSAMFLAMGLLLPFLTGQIKQIGSRLLPMHIPVLLCGLICGRRYGLTVGFIMPLLRCAVFTMPKLYPDAVSMAFELAAYGYFSGLFYSRSHSKCISTLYRSMITAMILGRVVWGILQAVLLGLGENGFTVNMFAAGAFFNAIPGIILQLVFIPSIMIALDRTGLIKFSDAPASAEGTEDQDMPV